MANSHNESRTGLVIKGSKNIFTVSIPPADCTHNETIIECRIKGKILKDADNYNPIAPGDFVTVDSEAGLILDLCERKNMFSRFNQKGGASQLLAANVDVVLCMTTPFSPPFRPRFLDRVLLQADAAGLDAVIVCNKYDLAADDASQSGQSGVKWDTLDIEERLEDFSNMGFQVLRVSAKTGLGLDQLRNLIDGKTAVLVGQSGVGKSSIINALAPEANIRVGGLNEKYDRGNHVTTMSLMVTIPAAEDKKETRLIDTPGLRRFVPDGIKASDLMLHLREFASLAGKCSYGLSCSHEREPGCKIMEAVNFGVIHEDRYTSFLRIRDELLEKENEY